MNRRQLLILGGFGGAAAVAAGVGLSRFGLPGRDPSSPAIGDEWWEPAVQESRDGVLRVELVASVSETRVAGRRARMLTYNGGTPGETWRVRPGDRIEVRFRNELDTPTNLHTHGLEVSPEGNGDNPFLSIEPGQSFDYRFDLPDDHPTGVFWYHPHRHGTVADQLFGGLFGALIVDGDQIPNTRERVMVVSDTTLTAEGDVATVSPQEVMMGREGDLLLVNGQQQPQLSARPGERERWRVINACTSRYLRLALPGQDLLLLGIDGGHPVTPKPVEEILLAPGNRADLLVTMRAGTSELRTQGYDRGGMGMMGRGRGQSGPATLASLVVTGDEVPADETPPERTPSPDLRGTDVTGRREIAFTMGMGGMGGRMMEFGFDGRVFDGERIDQQVAAGGVEEWVITNATPMDHPFHLHVWPMQLVEADGQPVDDLTIRDVVNVRAQSSVRVLVDFARHPGRSVYHCHILDHEDVGMMGTVEVNP